MSNFSLNNMDKEEISFLLWQYFHQSLSTIEMEDIRIKLQHSAEWQEIYALIEEEERQLVNDLTEQPSMRFTKNVMEAITPLEVKKPIRTYINKRWIQLAVVFFLCVIGGAFIWMSVEITQHWDSSKSFQLNLKMPTKIPDFSFTNKLNPQLVYGFYGLNLVVIMFFINRILIHRLKNKNASKIV